MDRGLVRRLKFVCVLVLFLMLVPMSCVAVCQGASQADAEAAVAGAGQRIGVCYTVAADATKAGANVSGLLLRLNDAGSLLSKAELALGQGDFNSAYNLAVESEGELNGFESVASGLKNTAVKAGTFDFWFYVVGPSLGAAYVLVLGFFVWLLLRKRYPGVS